MTPCSSLDILNEAVAHLKSRNKLSRQPRNDATALYSLGRNLRSRMEVSILLRVVKREPALVAGAT